jgi:hypothetical protein
LVSLSGKKMERDMVQFLPFYDFVKKDLSLLSAEVCAEFPRQIEVFANLNPIFKLFPNPNLKTEM